MNRDKDWDGRPLYYDRHGQPMTMHQWAEKFEDENYTHIARDVIGPDEPLDPAPLITVSTVWRSMNHNWRHDEPLIYETLIIGGGYDATGMRYATEKQAREGHRRVVEELRAAAVRVLRRRWPHQPVRTSLRPMRGTRQEVRSGRRFVSWPPWAGCPGQLPVAARSWFRPVQPVVGRVRNTRRNLPIWISSPLSRPRSRPVHD